MAAHSGTPSPTPPSAERADTSRYYQEGMVAGILGATTIALWFLILDAANGRPLFTPTVLGTALFRGTRALESPASLPISGEMVFMFTWVHGLVFAAIGGLVGRLLLVAERNSHLGFGVVLIFVGLEIGFVIASLMFAEPVLDVLPWGGVLIGNLLAAAVMVGYLWYRHPTLRIEP